MRQGIRHHRSLHRLDGSSWHGAGDFVIPGSIIQLPLPPYSPELNTIESVWRFLRNNYPVNGVFDTCKNIVDVCCTAWNALIAVPMPNATIATIDWANVNA